MWVRQKKPWKLAGGEGTWSKRGFLGPIRGQILLAHYSNLVKHVESALLARHGLVKEGGAKPLFEQRPVSAWLCV